MLPEYLLANISFYIWHKISTILNRLLKPVDNPMDVPKSIPEVIASGACLALAEPVTPEAVVFSGRRAATTDAHENVESPFRQYLQGKMDFFKQPGLKKNTTLKSLFPSCACLDLGRQFMKLARANDQSDADNSAAMIELIMKCSRHPKFVPVLGKLFPDFPTPGQKEADFASATVEDKNDGNLFPVGSAEKSENAEPSASQSDAHLAASGDVAWDPPVLSAESVLVKAVIPLHACPDDKAEDSWSAEKQNDFIEMRDMLVFQRIYNEDTSDFRGQKFMMADTGNTASQCGTFSRIGTSRTIFYEDPDARDIEAEAKSRELAMNSISLQSIKKELDALTKSLSMVAGAGQLPVDCDLVIQLYRKGAPGHTRSFSVWQEGDDIKYGSEAPAQETVQRRTAVISLTAESLALLNACQILDAQIVLGQNWINVSGDPGLVAHIKTLIARQRPKGSDR